MATDTHVSRAVCQMLSGMTGEKVTPDDIVVFKGVIFGECEIIRRFNPDNRNETPTRMKGYIAYTEDGEPLNWAMDNYHPAPGKSYDVFALQRHQNKTRRRNLEIPVIADPTLLGSNEAIMGSLTTETILQEVIIPPRSNTQVLGFGTGGKKVCVKKGASLPLNQRRCFLVCHSGLDEVEVFALAEATLEQTNDLFVVEVNGSLFRWPNKLGIDGGLLLSLTMEDFDATVAERSRSIRDAYDRAVKQDRRLRGYPDEAAEAKIKTERFPPLVILEACILAGKEWIARRDEAKALAEPQTQAGGNGKDAAPASPPAAKPSRRNRKTAPETNENPTS